MRIGVWEYFECLESPRTCTVCAEKTSLGGKEKLELCIKHETWPIHLKQRFGI